MNPTPATSTPHAAAPASPAGAVVVLRSASGEGIDWRRLALCAQVDPELFFPDKGMPSLPARRVCGACPVRPECAADALASGQRFGVWGGMSERTRRGIQLRTRTRTGATGAGGGEAA